MQSQRAPGASELANCWHSSPGQTPSFASNALMACGALEALNDSHLACPTDIAIACFDQLAFFDLLRAALDLHRRSLVRIGGRRSANGP